MPAAATPAYRMPAEWEPERATWIAWPHHAADWPGKFAAIPWVYAEIVRHLAESESVCLLVADAKMQARARRLLRRGGGGRGGGGGSQGAAPPRRDPGPPPPFLLPAESATGPPPRHLHSP